VPAARPAPQPADALGAGPAAGGRGAAVVVVFVEGSRRDVVVVGSRCDALVEGIALDASVLGTINTGAIFGPDRAARGWGPLHAETARSNAIAPAQSRRHTALSIAARATACTAPPELEILPRPKDAAGGSGAVAPDPVSLSWLKITAAVAECAGRGV
jgi:hypothetical protein